MENNHSSANAVTPTSPAMSHVQRVNYFYGKLLSAEDLMAEQDYFRERLRRHNRCVCGWGVVCGLTATLHGAGEVRVQPGMALDCWGNEIALESEAHITLPKRATKLFLAIEYAEALTAPLPTPDGNSRFTRVREESQLALDLVDPCANHRGRGPGTPGCGNAHGVTIAVVTKKGAGWVLRHRNRAA